MCNPCPQALLPRSGPHPKQIVLVGPLQTQPLLSPLPLPGQLKDHLKALLVKKQERT